MIEVSDFHIKIFVLNHDFGHRFSVKSALRSEYEKKINYNLSHLYMNY